MKLEELRVYQRSMDLAEKVWSQVINVDYFLKDTIGKQLIRSVDSIAANLSEGFGRYHYKEVRNFDYYSRGSLYETKTWLTKAYNRKIIQKNEYDDFVKEINDIGVKLNNYIKSIDKASYNQVKEDEGDYNEI